MFYINAAMAMQRIRLIVWIVCLLLSFNSLFALSTNTNTVLLFSFFRENGQDGLFLAWSRDGLKWEELESSENSFLRPTLGDMLMRDPCLAQGPDGRFHMVWTTSWRNRIIGYAYTSDLLDWSKQKAIPVMQHESSARNAWAPELFFDTGKEQWLIFWSTTIPGRFPDTEASGDSGLNHRIYYTMTRDFVSFSPTRLFYDGGFNVIDGTLLPAGDKYYLIVKDETRNPVKKYLRLVSGRSPEGPWGPASPPFTTNYVEGPSAIQLGNDYYVYFDHYAKPHYYGAVRSPDLEHWTDISSQLQFPTGIRHGTVLRVSEKVVKTIQNQTRHP